MISANLLKVNLSARLNATGKFPAQVDFALWAAKGLAYFRWLLNSLLGLYLGARTASPSRYCQALLGIGIPENTQAALAKISIRGSTCRWHFKDMYNLLAIPMAENL